MKGCDKAGLQDSDEWEIKTTRHHGNFGRGKKVTKYLVRQGWPVGDAVGEHRKERPQWRRLAERGTVRL